MHTHTSPGAIDEGAINPPARDRKGSNSEVRSSLVRHDSQPPFCILAETTRKEIVRTFGCVSPSLLDSFVFIRSAPAEEGRASDSGFTACPWSMTQ